MLLITIPATIYQIKGIPLEQIITGLMANGVREPEYHLSVYNGSNSGLFCIVRELVTREYLIKQGGVEIGRDDLLYFTINTLPLLFGRPTNYLYIPKD